MDHRRPNAADWARTAQAGDYLITYEASGFSDAEDPGGRCGYEVDELLECDPILRARGLTLTNDLCGLLAVTLEELMVIPDKNGTIVELRDYDHYGTAIFWSAARGEYIFVGYDQRTVESARRCILVGDVSIKAIGTRPYGSDLTENLTLIGVTPEDDLAWLGDTPLLWDSEHKPGNRT